MKSGLAIAGLVFCSMAQANLEDSADRLGECISSYAESQVATSKPANSIAEEAFDKCSPELDEMHDTIGPNKHQWDNLSKQQQQAIMKLRDDSTTKIRERLTSQIIKYVTEERKS